MRNLFPVTTDFAFPDTAFDNFFNGLFQPTPSTQYRVPKVDIEETEKAYILTTDLPGMKKEDITITYADDILTIGAQHKVVKEAKAPEADAAADAKTQEAKPEEEHHYIRKERVDTAFSRQFVVRDIQREGIKAGFEDGVLTITLPKQDPNVVQASHRIDIQ